MKFYLADLTRGEAFDEVHKAVRAFVHSHGERRIMSRSHRALEAFDGTSRTGELWIAYTPEHEIVGVTFESADRDTNFTVVRKDTRIKGIGKALIQKKLEGRTPGTYKTMVVTDNLPSLRLMFSVGLVGVGMTETLPGRPAIIFTNLR